MRLGEATLGAHECYALRAGIARRLIEEPGFEAVVIEGDWPDMRVLKRTDRHWLIQINTASRFAQHRRSNL